MRIDAVICLWHWAVQLRDKWALAEVFGVNRDGRVCTPSKLACDERCPWRKWLYRDDGDYLIGIPGRAVTMCSLLGGVNLVDFIPPTDEWPEWLGPEFVQVLRKTESWAQAIGSGHRLYLGTVRAAQELMFQEDK